jgi:hypothetical protein
MNTRLPLTRNPRATARIPTSPRKRGEVISRCGQFFHTLSAEGAAISSDKTPCSAAQGQPLHMSRHSRAISCWTTSLSVGLNEFFSAAAGSALFSTSRSMSISILVVRNSAEADLLTSWAMTASRLVTCRRLPFSVTVTFSLSAAANSAARFFAGRPRGLPDWPFLKRVWMGGLR